MIGIIGAGNMGMAIASAIKGDILLSDKNKRISDNVTVAKRSNIIILAVKPQDMAEVLKEIKPYAREKLVISIAAGVTTPYIEKILGRARVIRVMPNMPAMVGKGVSAITRGRFARHNDLKRASGIFLKVGDVVEVEESAMDAVTAVSGSGPAYYFLFTHLLAKAGEASGLEKGLAMKLAKAAFIGAAELAARKNLSMEEFVKKVASKGGTTEAALKIFKSRKLEGIVGQAVKSASLKSRSLTASLHSDNVRV